METIVLAVLSITVTGTGVVYWTCSFICTLGRRKKQMLSAVRVKGMLTQVLVTFPSSSNSEHQCKTQKWAIPSETRVLHLPFSLPSCFWEIERKWSFSFLLKFKNLMMAVLLSKEEAQVDTSWILVFFFPSVLVLGIGQVVLRGTDYQEPLRWAENIQRYWMFSTVRVTCFCSKEDGTFFFFW